jgi:hypothetical protein
MSSIRADMIGGFNNFIKSQQDAKIGTCRVFAYKFDTTYEPMFEDVDLYQCPLLDNNNYEPRGGTALYDSLGKTIVDIGMRLESTPEEERPEKVLFVTITDGEDNSHLELSQGLKRYDNQQIKEMVEHQKSKYNWGFAYIGANQDSWAVGSSMGYSKGTTLNYVADSAGTAMAFDTLDRSVATYRCASIGSDFKFEDDSADTDDAVDAKSKAKASKKRGFFSKKS